MSVRTDDGVASFSQPSLSFLGPRASLPSLLPLGVVYVVKSSFYDGIKAIQKIKTVSAVIPSDLQAAGLCMYRGLDFAWEGSLLLTRLHRPRRKGRPPPFFSIFSFSHFPIPQSLANQQSDYAYNWSRMLTLGPPDESCNYRSWPFLT